mmetsp:Transcript_11903/g.34358  ORF Transcript_11903/g.34358 Transcript_11903/m.34358 type:complete len:80 (+) Transcript_11903:183-422(+)
MIATDRTLCIDSERNGGWGDDDSIFAAGKLQQGAQNKKCSQRGQTDRTTSMGGAVIKQWHVVHPDRRQQDQSDIWTDDG